MFAAWNGRKETVRLLLEKGADFNTKDAAGRRNALSYASTGSVKQLLRDAGAKR